jgi:tRNA G18 (ribose-2'-O)-methylase SpoU
MTESLSSEADSRNVTDEFKGMSVEAIKKELDIRRFPIEIAIENLERDFNAGTIMRNANAFNVRAVHIVGRRQWNKRGAMATDHYMNVYYHPSVDEFVRAVSGKHVIGIDNIEASIPLHTFTYPKNPILVFGSEGPGLSKEMINVCEAIVAIEQFGSTRSVNVGVASGIAMYSWFQQSVL